MIPSIAAAAPRFEAKTTSPILRISANEALRSSIHTPAPEKLETPVDVELVLSQRGRVVAVSGAPRRVERTLRKWRFHPIVANGKARRAIVTLNVAPE